MIKWVFNNYYLEGRDTLFYIAVGVLLLIILLTIYFVCKELKNENK